MTESRPASPRTTDTAAVVDLLGAIAYGELSAFERLVEDAKLAPTLEDKVAIGGDGHRRVRPPRSGCTSGSRELGADPFEAMAGLPGRLRRASTRTPRPPTGTRA